MIIEQLTETAHNLVQPPPEAAQEFTLKRDRLADALSRRLGKREDLVRLIGEGNQAMMEDNSRNFCRFMATMFSAYDADVLVRTVLWVFRAYRTHGFQLTFWAAELDVFVEIIRDELSAETCEAIMPFYDWMIVNIPSFAKVSDEAIADFKPPVHG